MRGPKLDRKRLLIAVGIVTAGIIVISQLPPMAIVSLEWGVSPGDETAFRVTAPEVPSTFPWSFLPYAKMSFCHLNNTIIIANVTNLPSLSWWYTSNSFISDVAGAKKVSCIFENGTPISDDDSIVSDLISQALLPIGSWHELDALFPDDYIRGTSFGSYTYTWVARQEAETFFFGHQGSYAEGTIGWTSLSNYTTGIPHMIHYYDYYGDNGPNFTLEFIGYFPRAD